MSKLSVVIWKRENMAHLKAFNYHDKQSDVCLPPQQTFLFVTCELGTLILLSATLNIHKGIP
jgi:hypothetical protein